MRLPVSALLLNWGYLLVLLLSLTACQPATDREVAEADQATPPVGHYEGSLTLAGQPAVRVALDIRHPSPGHYEAELTAPDISTLNFVADTLRFVKQQLQLTRPGHPGEVLALTLDGDFWRGTLSLDSLRADALLVKRGPPTPSSYRVEEVPQPRNSAWLFTPADTTMAGPALALLPDSATVSSAPIWADALAREGFIVLLLPADSGSAALPASWRLLQATAGADTARIGVWATGSRTLAVARHLAGARGSRCPFFVAQNAMLNPASRADFRALLTQKTAVLGLYGGNAAGAASLRAALGGRRGTAVRQYRQAGVDLLLPGAVGPRFASNLLAEVVAWLHER